MTTTDLDLLRCLETIRGLLWSQYGTGNSDLDDAYIIADLAAQDYYAELDRMAHAAGADEPRQPSPTVTPREVKGGGIPQEILDCLKLVSPEYRAIL